MIYVVSGYMRTGTSMMMKALEAGGLEAAFNPVREEMNAVYGDEHYKPNPGGFYELQRKEYSQEGFPRMYDGKLLKCLWGAVKRIIDQADINYKIIFMLRNPEEIRQSFEAFFDGPAEERLKAYRQIMNQTLSIIRGADNAKVLPIVYKRVIRNPIEMFEKIKDFGVPIDVNKAASIVDPKLYRFRLENLEIGI